MSKGKDIYRSLILANSASSGEYNQALLDVLRAIDDPSRVVYNTTPTGCTVIYKETLVNVVKKMMK